MSVESDTRFPDSKYKAGRSPWLPPYALLLFRLPSVLTLRALFALPAFGVTGHAPKYHYTLSGIGSDGAIASAVSCSALYHFAVMNLTSRVNFVQ